MKAKVLVIGMLLWGGLVCNAAGEPNLHDGMWEITTTMEMPGMPSGMQPVKHTQCITKKDMVPKAQDLQQQECSMSTPSVSGNTVTWTVNCKTEDGMIKGAGKIMYKGDTFDGTLTMTIQEPEQGGTMQIVQRMSGKRMGECN